MPLYSIPPVQRGLVKDSRGSRLRTTLRSRANAGPGAAAIRPTPQGLSSFAGGPPSIHDVNVTRTPKRATWEFPYGEFEVTLESGEIHVEVRIGRFVDALIIENSEVSRS